MKSRRCRLFSTYELGHQPLALASLAAELRAHGHEVSCHDLSVEPLNAAWLSDTEVACISVPMHTAGRLGVELAARIRSLNPQTAIVLFGTYGEAVSELARRHQLADAVFSGEYEPSVVSFVGSAAMPRQPGREPVTVADFARQNYVVPDRTGLPPLTEYSRLQTEEGLKLAGYVEATRGCAHSCTHCPLTPVYGGRLRLIQPQVVLADIDQQVALGAEHISFGDPDYLNASSHSVGICTEMRRRHPNLTFDITAKVEHLVEYSELLPQLKDLGCLFVTSAFESTNDQLLSRLGKGHSREDMERALSLTADSGLFVRPTWMAFTPWTSASDYLDLIEFVERQDLIDHVQPVQYGLRLLLPPGSPLIGEAEKDGLLGGFDAAGLTYGWRNPDPRMDTLQEEISAFLGGPDVDDCGGLGENEAGFVAVREAAYRALSGEPPPQRSLRVPHFVPGLTESWFC